jgi:capsular polysaccharide biosynthesis protein
LATTLENRAPLAPSGPLTAMRRHWILALIPVLLLVGAAVQVGLKRTPRFTATAHVTVGSVFVSSPVGIASALQGTESLASVYSRLIDATAVTQITSRRLAEHSLPNSGTVSATPIADSPIVKVTAVAASERQAIALANAASSSLVEYVNREGSADDDANTIARLYEAAALRFRQQADVRNRIVARYKRHPTEANRRTRDRAAAATDTALLRRDGLLARYQTAVQGVTARPPLRVLTSATAASSDRYTTLQILVFVGVLGGLAAGAALALLRTPRSPRQPSR